MQLERTAFMLATVLTCAVPLTAWAQAAPKLVDKLQFWNLDEYEAKSGAKVTAFKQAPMLDAQVASGTLPPVEKRLPQREDIVVVQPRESIGAYGGTISSTPQTPTPLPTLDGRPGRPSDRLHHQLGRDRP